jgi:hypothetical protein
MALLGQKRQRTGATALRRRTRAGIALAVAASLAAPAFGQAAAAQPGALEYAVKANYLYKFAPFVEWPARVFASAASPFNICVLGADPFGRALDEAVRGQRIEGRAISVRRLRSAADVDDCHVLYLGRQPPQAADQTLKALRGTPVLTVTDAGQGVQGGIVHFVLVEGRVRFSLDPNQAQANGIVLSSKLRALAAPTLAR